MKTARYEVRKIWRQRDIKTKRYEDKEKEVADINSNADQLEEQVKILQKKEKLSRTII